MEAVFFEWLYILDLVINLEHLIIGDYIVESLTKHIHMCFLNYFMKMVVESITSVMTYGVIVHRI
jgi:hypothetical protein